MSENENYGNVYEIKLANDKYVYVCWMREFGFGIFNYISKEVTNLEHLLPLGFKAYKDCNEKATKRKIWKLIGHVDLDKENIQYSDLVTFMSYDKEGFIERSIVMRDGNMTSVSKEEYIALLKKGYIYGFFSNYETFERWLVGNIETHPDNYEIYPLPDGL